MSRPLPSTPRLTSRLALRPFRRRDADALAAAVRASVPELARWLPWPHPRYGRIDALRFIRDSTTAWAEGRAHDLAIRDRADENLHLGSISVWPTSRREQSGEIGYWVHTDFTGRGIAAEAVARVLTIAFEELDMHRVVLRIAVGNRASERVAEKVGFVREGLLRKEVLVGGAWLDHSLWALLDEDYWTQRSGLRESGAPDD
jgi:ribosomal-protein-serine acetyltransferase